eukprot:TRINITY_DN6057_c0_g1_i1.p1 TRINITY_DN6057_c0_g1~~TRINITY_DN6057_c0_g1_i1.p1  ORF type:complete len:719 (+),score=191.83 TRINITY_DN6057_c0_g1_i1:208-2157(+)
MQEHKRLESIEEKQMPSPPSQAGDKSHQLFEEKEKTLARPTSDDDLYILTRDRGIATAAPKPMHTASEDLQDILAGEKNERFIASWKGKLAQMISLDPEQRRLLFYTTMLLLSVISGAVYSKKTTIAFSNYPFFLNQFITAMFVPVFGGVCLWKYFVTKQITDEMRKFPQFRFFMMGVFDSIANFLALFGAVYTSGSFQNLLSQTGIVFTLIFAYIYLKERYTKSQYLGVLLVVVGILIALAPQLADGGSAGNVPVFNLLFLSSAIPASMSVVYKEKAFDVDLEGNYLQYCNAAWQFVIGWALAPLNAVPILGPNTVPLDQIFPTCLNGLKCLGGINSIINECTFDGSDPTLAICDSCQGSWVPLTLYLILNMIQNVFYVLIIKHGGANVLTLITTLSLPLIQAAFAIRAINDPPDPLTWQGLVALFIIMAGLVIYGRKKKEIVTVESDPKTPLTNPMVVSVSLNRVHPGRVFEYLTHSESWNYWWQEGSAPKKHEKKEPPEDSTIRKSMVKELLEEQASDPNQARQADDCFCVGEEFSFSLKNYVRINCVVTEVKYGRSFRFIGESLFGMIRVRYRCVMDGDLDKTTTVFVETEYTASNWVQKYILKRAEVHDWNRGWLNNLRSYGNVELSMISNTRKYSGSEMAKLA